jgi:hypothetical protein
MPYNDSALVLTSTVQPSAPKTALLDPVQRKAQYMDALAFYIRNSLFTRIVICDNSGYPYPESVALHELAGFHDKKLELLSFSGNSASTAAYGKGWGEGEIMEYVLSHSKLIKEVKGFLKITGRLKIVNIVRLCMKIDPEQNYFNPISLLRPRFLVPRAARPCLDVRAYYVTNMFFREVLLDAYKKVRDNDIYFLEHAYHDAIAVSSSTGSPPSTPASSPVVKCFPVAPEITGISGSNGWIFKERSRFKKMLVRLASFLGYIYPLYRSKPTPWK